MQLILGICLSAKGKLVENGRDDSISVQQRGGERNVCESDRDRQMVLLHGNLA